MPISIHKFFSLVLAGFLVLFALRWFLPVCLPFLLGAALALGAEPFVRRLSRHLPRPLAAGIGISLTLVLVTLVLIALVALLFGQLRRLAGIAPDLIHSIQGGMDSLSRWLVSLAQKMPAEFQSFLTRHIQSAFSDGSALLSQSAAFLLHLASGIISHVPGSALWLFTGILSSYMISAKWPFLSAFLRRCLPEGKLQGFFCALHRLRRAVGGWLKAQLTLSGVTALLTLLGLFLLKIPHPFLWALLVALVDALPILGSGAVFVPWSLVSFLQGDRFIAFGLLFLYGLIALTRSLLEPRLVGKHLGLDPLATLIALYAGFRLWGIGGMLLAPLLTAMAVQLLPSLHSSDTSG